MSKNQLIATTLVIFLLVGTLPLVIGATLDNPGNNVTISTAIATANVKNPNNAWYYTQIRATWVTANYNQDLWAYILYKYNGKNLIGWKKIKPGFALQEECIFAVLNNAAASGKYVNVHIDSNGYIDYAETLAT